MLGITTKFSDATPAGRFSAGEPASLLSYLGGTAKDLREMESAVTAVLDTRQPRHLPLHSESGTESGKKTLHLFYAERGFHILPLSHGLLICADEEGLREISSALRACLENAAGSAPVDG